MTALHPVESLRSVLADVDWKDICALDEIPPGLGSAALIEDEQIAIVRTRDGRIAALSNFDPFSKAFVIARGIIGDRAGVPKITSPVYKQSFSIETGECLEDPNVKLTVFPTRIIAGRIQVAVPTRRRAP